jgi:hypothetical protein
MVETLDAHEAEKLFGAGGEANDSELLARAAASWTATPDADLAEVARFARIVAYRAGDRIGAELWQARAVAAAAGTGALRSLALSLQLHFFSALSTDAFDQAEAVLVEIERLSGSDHEGLPDPNLVARIVAERRALLSLKRADFSAAVKWYDIAIARCPEGSRGYFKVAGGRARAAWLGGGSSMAAANELERIAKASQSWDDVHRAALANHEASLAGDQTKSVPFDLE